MKILHYTLGLPPFRTGGLTKYSYDLMLNELKLNEKVFLLYPGHFNFLKNSKIVYEQNYLGIEVYELVNPLPVPLLGGVKNPKYFMKKFNINIFIKFLDLVKPDIVHIHTLMGMPVEFLDALKNKNIKTIYTTHDYFGLCPKVNLFKYNNEVCNDYDLGKNCVLCNQKSYNILTLFFLQSKYYKYIKNFIIKYLSYVLIDKEKIFKRKKIKVLTSQGNNQIIKNSIKYVLLRDYYLNILHKIDYFHYNSSLTMKEYTKYITGNGDIIHITHQNIYDNRVKKDFNNDKLRITYIGPIDSYKGFFLLKNSLDKLIYKGITNWHINIYGNIKKIDHNSIFYSFNGRYSIKDLDNIFLNTDLLIIPSLCFETFGFVGLEALSYGVPIILTENVGLKDLIINGKTGFIITPSSEELSNLLIKIINDRSILRDINKNILFMDFNYSIYEHTIKIIDLYKKVISYI
jgi:glycosyltransferase involved in cell wall biosynthesis